MNIGIDLDSVVFDMEPLYKKAFENTGVKFYRPQFWKVHDCYPTHIADKLIELFTSKTLFKMPLLSPVLPKVITNAMCNGNNIKFITARRGGETPEKADKLFNSTYNQCYRAGFRLGTQSVVLSHGDKAETLKQHSIDLHFDDSPIVIEACIKNGVDCELISNVKTPYNHYLRSKVSWSPSLRKALEKRGLV